MLALLDAWFIAPFDYGFMRRAVVAGWHFHWPRRRWGCFWCCAA